ncbi:MAG: DNA recombination protein RmuC, partial [Ruegeria sp.]
MIKIAGNEYTIEDPMVLAALTGLALIFLILLMLFLSLRAASRSARMAEPLAQQMAHLGQNVQQLG